MADENEGLSNDNTDAGIEKHQVEDGGNPKPKEPLAKPPVDDKTEDKPDDKKEDDKSKEAENKEQSEEKEDDKPLDTDVWGDTGSETGNAVLQLLQNSGVPIGEAKELLFDAVVEGKPENIDKAKLEEKVGKVKAHLILTGVKAFVKDTAEKAQGIVKTIHETVGGESNWKQIASWAKDNVDKEQLADLSELIDQGGVKAKLAAKELKELYEAADGNSSLDTKEVTPKGGTPKDTPFRPLSASQYAEELERLHNAHNGNPPEQLRRALLQARNKGKQQGL